MLGRWDKDSGIQGYYVGNVTEEVMKNVSQSKKSMLRQRMSLKKASFKSLIGNSVCDTPF